jgi:hypothetical protein
MTHREQQYESGTDRSQEDPGATHRQLILRRKFLKLGAAGGAALVASVYVKPSFRSIGALPAYAQATPVGGDGCTPGYWKNHNDWPSPYTWTTHFSDDYPAGVFDTGLYGGIFGTLTLYDALTQKGGCEKALGRHGVAALLNAADLGISFGLSVDDVKAKVKSGLASSDCAFIESVKDELEGYNEASCPLGGKAVHPDDDK